MTTPICRHCNEPVHEHKGRKLDICVAKAEGLEVTYYETLPPENRQKCYQLKDKAPEFPLEDICLYVGDLELPHYSTDDSVAVKELWKNGWNITKFTSRYVVRHCNNWIIAEAKTLAIALALATLTEDAKEA